MRKARLILPLALVIAVAIVGGLDGGRRRRWQVAGEGGLDVLRATCGHATGAPAHDPDVMACGGTGEETPRPRRLRRSRSRSSPAPRRRATSRPSRPTTCAPRPQGLADGKSPRELAPTVDLRDWDVRVVVRDALEALTAPRPRSREADHRRGGEERRDHRVAGGSDPRQGRTRAPRWVPQGGAEPRRRRQRGLAEHPSAGVRPREGPRLADLPRMKKLSLVVSLISLVVFAVPATAPAKGGKSPAKDCKALRAQMGADSFRAAFGSKQGKNALGRCVSTQRKARRDARKRARKACRAKGLRGKAMKRCFRQELAADPAPKPGRLRGRGRRSASRTRPRTSEDFAAEFGDGPSGLRQVRRRRGSDDEAESRGPSRGRRRRGFTRRRARAGRALAAAPATPGSAARTGAGSRRASGFCRRFTRSR